MTLNIHSFSKYIAVLITIILIAIFLTQISIQEIFMTLQQINPIYLLAGFALYTCSYVFRAWRFHILLNKEVSITDLFNIGCVHNMMNNLMPARTGELSYIYLLKKVNQRTTGEGVATLIVARIFDFIALTILFFVGVSLIKDIPPVILNALWLVTIFFILLCISLMAILYFGRPFLKGLQKIFKITYLDTKSIGIYLLNKGSETIFSLDKIKMKNHYIILLFQSVLIWSFNFFLLYIIFQGMHFDISILKIMLGATFILLTTILPIQGIGGFGTTEAVWVIVFVPLGMPLDDAIISGFCYHFIVLAYFIVLGVYGWIKIKN